MVPTIAIGPNSIGRSWHKMPSHSPEDNPLIPASFLTRRSALRDPEQPFDSHIHETGSVLYLSDDDCI